MKQIISRALAVGFWGAIRIVLFGAALLDIALNILYQSNLIESILANSLLGIIFLALWIMIAVIYGTTCAITAVTQVPTPEALPTFWSVIRRALWIGLMTIGSVFITGYIVSSIEVAQDTDEMAGMGGVLFMLTAPIVGLIVIVINTQIGFAYKETMEAKAWRESL